MSFGFAVGHCGLQEYSGEFSPQRPPSPAPQPIAPPITSPSTIYSVEAGEQFSCRIKTLDNTIQCWGRPTGRTAPPGGAFFHISLGSKFGCGLRLSDHKPQCWGENPPSVPAAAPALTTISSGGVQHACGITDNQTVFCWGNTAPIPANAVDMQFAFIAASRDPDSNAVCGIPVDEDVPVQCWGSPRPTVPNSTSFSSIGLGRGFWCAINKNTRKVECSGNQDVSSDLQQPVLRDFEDPISVHVNSACALRVIAGIFGAKSACAMCPVCPVDKVTTTARSPKPSQRYHGKSAGPQMLGLRRPLHPERFFRQPKSESHAL